MVDGRPAILMSTKSAAFRASRTHVDNAAHAVVLAATDEGARGRVYNVGERDALAWIEWARLVAAHLRWNGELVVAPSERMPTGLRDSRPDTWDHRVVADADEAEDVAQDVFVSFYRKHPADAHYAAPWLYAAAAHTALNVLRARERRGKRDAVEAIRRDAQTRDPAQAAETAETRSEVRAALARLPNRSAALLALRYSGLSHEEIAAALGLRQSSIGTLLRRAEDAFRREVTT